MSKVTYVLGCDVSKKKIDVALLNSQGKLQYLREEASRGQDIQGGGYCRGAEANPGYSGGVAEWEGV